MAMKRVSDLQADTTLSLGGFNKTTGKANPTHIKGYYLGVRTVMVKNKECLIYTFQTSKGNTAVWGKADLNNKMKSVPLGAFVEVNQNGTRPTPNGTMFKFDVDFDEEDTVAISNQTNDLDAALADDSDEDTQLVASNASTRASRVSELLNNKAKTKN